MLSQKINQHLQLLVFYTRAKLEAETYRHFAGYLWWLFDPLIGVGIYYFLFKVIMNRGEENFIIFLLIGLTVWKWISDTITKSSSAILSNLDLLKKIKLSAHIFPIVEIFYNTWKFLLIFSLMILTYGIFGSGFSLNHLLLLPILLSSLVFITGISIFLSGLIPFLPDLNFFISNGMKLIFYASGVLYVESRVPEKYQYLLAINPIFNLLKSVRDVVIHLNSPSFFSIIYPMLIGLVFGIIGLIIINHKNQEYPKLH